MPGISPTLRLDPGNAVCAFNLDELPVAAILCRQRDRRCIAVNRLFEQVLGCTSGSLAGRATDEILIEPRDPREFFGCRDVLLRGLGGEAVAMLMVPWRVVSDGERAVVCAFVERGVQRWRNGDLVSAIDAVIRDDMQWFSGAVMERLARRRSSIAPGTGLDHLTPRELQVLKLVCEGRDDAHIAAELVISPNTLRNHLSNIYGKAGIRRRSDAVVWGRERGVTVS